MSLKVTIFGPVHAGKSTLAGYLRWLGARAESERDIARARAELGAAFDEAQALAYLVDRSGDERARNPSGGQTTSKRLHISAARLGAGNEIEVIDTPGGWRQHRDQRLRGLYYGDVGVFAIEPIADDISAARLGETSQARAEAFSALLTWVALRPDAPLIVVVTKSDLPGHDRHAFKRTTMFVDEVLGRRVAPIYVPTSINVRARGDWNVSGPGAAIADWEPDVSLAGALAGIKLSTPPTLEEPIMLVTKRSERPGRGTIYLGKVITGSFRRGDRVRMAPVGLPRSGGFAALTARAAFLEISSGSEAVDQLVAGDIGGIGLASGSLRDAVEQESTLITHESVPLAQGRYISLIVASRGRPNWLKTQVHIDVVWLGRYYQCKVHECEETDVGLRVGALVQLPAGLAIPLRSADGAMVLDEVMVSPVAEEVQFINARIASLGHVIGLRIPADTDREHLFTKIPALRAVTRGDVIDGDEAVMDQVASLLTDRASGERPVARYSVISATSANGG